VSRAVDRLAENATAALRAITPLVLGVGTGRPLLIDMDATLVTAHSEKEGAAPTFKKGFGHHPLVDLR
jgi:hypothetical protein